MEEADLIRLTAEKNDPTLQDLTDQVDLLVQIDLQDQANQTNQELQDQWDLVRLIADRQDPITLEVAEIEAMKEVKLTIKITEEKISEAKAEIQDQTFPNQWMETQSKQMQTQAKMARKMVLPKKPIENNHF